MAEQIIGDRCTNCNGSKQVVMEVDEGLGVQVDCPDCNGTGIVNSPNACVNCKGSGKDVVPALGFNVEVDCEHCQGSGLKPV